MVTACSNTVSFFHDNIDMINRIKKSIKDKKLFKEFVPDLVSGEEDNVYSGTKGNAHDVMEIEIFDNKIEMCFDTNWSAPSNFYDKMWELGFKIDATYIIFDEECGYFHTDNSLGLLMTNHFDIEGKSSQELENSLPDRLQMYIETIRDNEYLDESDNEDDEEN